MTSALDSVDLNGALSGVARGVLSIASNDWVGAAKGFTEAALALVPVDVLKTWLDEASAAQADSIADAAEKAKFG